MNHINIFFRKTRNYINSFKESGSFRNNFVLILSSGIFTAVLSFTTTPIISRIYPPNEYGVFSLFNSYLGIVSFLATWGYGNAVIYYKQFADGYSLFRLCLISTIFTALIIYLLILIGSNTIIVWLGLDKLQNLIWFIPIALILINLELLFVNFLIRNNSFKQISKYRVIKNISTRSLSIGIGFFVIPNALGMFIANQIGMFLSFILLLTKRTKLMFRMVKKINFKQDFLVLKRYKNYPKYIFPSGLINILSFTVPIILIGRYYGNSEVGYLSISSSLLGIVFSNLVSPVSESLSHKGRILYSKSIQEFRKFIYKLFKVLFFSGLLPVLIITSFGPQLFSFFLGSKWEMSGEVAGILIIQYQFFLISTPFAVVFRIMQKERFTFIFNISLLVLSCGSVFFLRSEPFLINILIYSIAKSIGFLIMIFSIFYLAKLNIRTLIIYIITFSIIISCIFFVRT